MIGVMTQMYEDETWKYLRYFRVKRDMYKVSDYGRIRNIHTNVILKPCLSEKGYLMHSLRCVDGRTRTIKLHRIVAMNFVDGMTEEKCEVDHKDGDKTNNKASNLEWVTRKENIIRAYERNLIPIMRGERNGKAKLNELLVEIACEFLRRNNLNCAAAFHDLSRIGVNTELITLEVLHDLKYKKRWKHVSDKYF